MTRLRSVSAATRAVLVSCLALSACASHPPPTARHAKETPAERFRRDAKRQQQEADERQRREDFMHRNDALRR
jgi:hypothetical protein